MRESLQEKFGDESARSGLGRGKFWMGWELQFGLSQS
jgi:hypothetical protein